MIGLEHNMKLKQKIKDLLYIKSNIIIANM